MKCSSCTRDIADGSRFCPYCGSTIPDATAENPAARPSLDPPPPVPAGAVYQSGFQQRAGQAVALGALGTVMSVGGCFCCVFPLASIGMGWAAFTRGRDELRDIDNGYIPPHTRGMAMVGMIFGILSLGMGSLAFLGSVAAIVINLLGASQRSYY